MKVNGVKIERPVGVCSDHIIEEVYCDTVLQTAEGNQLAVCMRDDTIELNVVRDGVAWWHRADMKTGTIEPMTNEEQPNED